MRSLSRRTFVLSVPSATTLAAGGGPTPDQAPNEVGLLANGIMALDPTIDPAEARRGADIGVNCPWNLRTRHKVEDPPIIRNMKVNAGR